MRKRGLAERAEGEEGACQRASVLPEELLSCRLGSRQYGLPGISHQISSKKGGVVWPSHQEGGLASSAALTLSPAGSGSKGPVISSSAAGGGSAETSALLLLLLLLLFLLLLLLFLPYFYHSIPSLFNCGFGTSERLASGSALACLRI